MTDEEMNVVELYDQLLKDWHELQTENLRLEKRIAELEKNEKKATREVDSYEPNYEGKCDVCGQSPTVTVVKDGKVLSDVGLCGPCCFGSAECLDPAKW